MQRYENNAKYGKIKLQIYEPQSYVYKYQQLVD